MKAGIANRVVKPDRCVMAFGIPTSESEFIEDLGRADKDFARRFAALGGWSRYDYEIGRVYEAVTPRLASLGVEIRERVTLQEFGQLSSAGRFDVIVLFSHWDSSRVEFSSGMADTQSIINQIANDFDGVLDLCVCHPDGLRDALKWQRQNCLVRTSSTAATPRLWLYFYLALFSHLARNDLTYLQALEQVIDEYLKEEREKKGRQNAICGDGG